jgi:uncharacterized protein (TIGR02145 family)
MKKQITSLAILFVLFLSSIGQNTIELTFTAENNGHYVPLDSIHIENLTQGGDTTLYAPDTVLVMDVVTSIRDNNYFRENTLVLTQNYPNPFHEKTEFELYLPEAQDIKISVSDLLGRKVADYDNTLARGNHSFVFYPGVAKDYLLTVTGKHTTQTIKMLGSKSKASSNRNCKIVYNEAFANNALYKDQQNINDFIFSLGDELKLSAYTDVEETELIESPSASQVYTFQFDGWTPCAEAGTVTDMDGNIYNTVQIGDQCWMKENLKTSTYNNGTSIPNVTDANAWSNLTTGAYVWYDNDISWKDKYGALYNWFTTVDPTGLCPTGWHVPTNDEWTASTDYIGGVSSPHGNEFKSCRQVNSPLGGGCNTSEHPRWNENSIHYGTDDYGFSGLPGGSCSVNGMFGYMGNFGDHWSSTEFSSNKAWVRSLGYDYGFVYVGTNLKRNGYSVRCIRDEYTQSVPEVETDSVQNITSSSAEAEGEILSLGSSAVIQHGHCWSSDPDPTTEDLKTELGPASMTGSFTSYLTGLDTATTYYVRAYATNNEGIAYGNEISFTTASEFVCGDPMTDVEGNTYNTVEIGTQCWMKENLKTTKYNNSTPIPNVTSQSLWSTLTSGAYVWYNNDSTWKESYGALYNWYTTVDTNNLCPTGWHVPTDDEWTDLTDFIGGTAEPHGNELKSCRQVNSPLGGDCDTSEHPRWDQDNTHYGTDDYGFSGLPGGMRGSSNPFQVFGESGFWWSSTAKNWNFAYHRKLIYNYGHIGVWNPLKQMGFSIRCIRDN